MYIYECGSCSIAGSSSALLLCAFRPLRGVCTVTKVYSTIIVFFVIVIVTVSGHSIPYALHTVIDAVHDIIYNERCYAYFSSSVMP